uniref:Tail assembly chaperone protein n=1 Tax=Micrococcus phage Kurnik TaxID=3092208 RepID=A0AAU6R662_9CAUD
MPSRTAPKTETAPAVQTPAQPYAPTTWGMAAEDLTMPSGQLAQVRRVDLQSLIAAGVIHSLDSLTPMMRKFIDKAEGKRGAVDAKTTEAIMKNPEQLADLLRVVDKVVVHVVVAPAVQIAPNDATQRKAGAIYTDMIDLMDRMYIFQYATSGNRSLENFRLQPAEGVGDVSDGAEDGRPSE